MKKFTSSILIVCLLCAALLLVYSMEIKPFDKLIHPPKFSPEGDSVQLALENEVGRRYMLKTPTDGENRSSIVYTDLDCDGKNEAVIFYSLFSEPDNVVMGVFKNENEGWSLIASVKSPYADVRQAEFADINGDGVYEIAVGYSSYTSEITQRLFVYALAESQTGFPFLACVFDSVYSKCAVFDVDSDGSSELLIFDSASSLQLQGCNLSVISFSQNAEYEKLVMPLDSSIAVVASVCFDYEVSPVCSRIYVDGYTADGKVLTDVLVYSSGTLERQLIDGNTVASVSIRSRNIVCSDINSDGTVDIPTDFPLEESSSAGSNSDEKINLINYVFISKNKLVNSGYYFENSRNGYYFKITPQLLEKITIVSSSDGATVKFYSLDRSDSENIKADKLLFELRTVTDLETGRVPSSYRSLGSNNEFYYYCKVYSAGEKLDITKSYIESYLKFELKGSSM